MQSITSLIDALTLEEKISLLSGKDFVTTPGVERLGISPLKVRFLHLMCKLPPRLTD